MCHFYDLAFQSTKRLESSLHLTHLRLFELDLRGSGDALVHTGHHRRSVQPN